jgi:hypothetical protein
VANGVGISFAVGLLWAVVVPGLTGGGGYIDLRKEKKKKKIAKREKRAERTERK